MRFDKALANSFDDIVYFSNNESNVIGSWVTSRTNRESDHEIYSKSYELTLFIVIAILVMLLYILDDDHSRVTKEYFEPLISI